MKRNDMVIEVTSLYDKIDELKLRINELELELADGKCAQPIQAGSASDNPEMSAIENAIYSCWRKVLYRKVVEDNSWRMMVKVERKGAVIIATDYSKWITGDVIDREKIPADVSFKQFYDFFETDLKGEYEKRKAKAVKALEKQELKEKLEAFWAAQ